MRETKPHVLFPLALNRRSLRTTQRLALRRIHASVLVHRDICVNVGEFSAPSRGGAFDTPRRFIRDFHPTHAVVFSDNGLLSPRLKIPGFPAFHAGCFWLAGSAWRLGNFLSHSLSCWLYGWLVPSPGSPVCFSASRSLAVKSDQTRCSRSSSTCALALRLVWVLPLEF